MLFFVQHCKSSQCLFAQAQAKHQSTVRKLFLLPKFLCGYDSGLLPKTQDTKFIQVTAVFSASSVNTQWYFLLQYGVSITYCT